MFDTLKAKLVNSPEWIISSGVFLAFWLVNKSYTGPSVLNDEIGYLANAALISGFIIDGASSYHAGYSFFLAPLFLLFSEPSQIWQAAMVLNAFLWAVSFLLLARILKTIVPQYDKGQLVIALLISALYPTWITMSGYVFTTTAFVFVYLIAVLTLLFWKPDNIWTIIPHAIAVGYLYWIHPVGLAVCIASVIVVVFVSLKEKSYNAMIFNIIVVVFFIFFYREVIDKWLVMLATPEDFIPLYQHYPGSESIMSRLFKDEFWIRLVSKSAGKISYLIVSSFGLILFGFIDAVSKSYHLIKKTTENNYGLSELINRSAYAFLVLSLLGVLATGVLFFSIGSSTRIDQWIYGRYAEMVVLPLLALGFLSFWDRTWHKKVLISAAFFVIATGLLLNCIVSRDAVNLTITTVAFWPQYMILDNNYLYWMAAGALLMMMLGLIKNYSRLTSILALKIIVIIFLFSIVVNIFVHHRRMLAYGTPAEFAGIIRENYSSGTCVGVNPEEFGNIRYDPQVQQYHLHLFHLYDYTYQRMSPEEWLSSCDGPYLTYALDGLTEQEGVKLIGQELHISLYMLVKDDGHNLILPENPSSIIFMGVYKD